MDGVEVIITPTPEETGTVGADAVEALFAAKHDAVLGIATGVEPGRDLRRGRRRVAAGRVSLAGGTAFMLDEYVGLPAEHPERYRNVVERDFVARSTCRRAGCTGPTARRTTSSPRARRYEAAIAAAGGVDLQILGVGSDGHIAFNEPGSRRSRRAPGSRP